MEEAVSTCAGVYESRGRPLEHCGWSVETVVKYVTAQLQLYEENKLEKSDLGGFAWTLPAKNTENKQPAEYVEPQPTIERKKKKKGKKDKKDKDKNKSKKKGETERDKDNKDGKHEKRKRKKDGSSSGGSATGEGKQRREFLKKMKKDNKEKEEDADEDKKQLAQAVVQLNY